jgi:hypothetical protein
VYNIFVIKVLSSQLTYNYLSAVLTASVREDPEQNGRLSFLCMRQTIGLKALELATLNESAQKKLQTIQ